ncbi:hypothetical protein P692DRAFT_20434781 [Suillus brevipes Sb2]|nr:hypothetical protein P692DRAFT_20434781 [Suillus brevipes Sb2]
MSSSQADALSSLNYIYVSLATLWVYDYILCIPDAVTLLADTRWGLSTILYLACSHLPFVFMFLNMLDVGIITMTCAECIFMVRAYAVWEQGRWFAGVEIFTVCAYIVPITVSLQQFNSRVSEPCWVPGISGFLDTETSTRIYIAFGLLALAELQTLLLLLYRAVKTHGGWGINNRLIRGLMKDNLLYCSSGFAFAVGIILTTMFFPFPVGHMVAEVQVVVQAFLVTRMHRNFRRSDRAFCGIPTDISLTTWMMGPLDFR